jgi:hypothetical protein
MSNQQPPVGGADAQEHLLASQVNLFLFDLRNEASEHGFRESESWNLEIATEDEVVSLKKQHHPVVSLRLQPQALLQAYQQVKNRLHQSLSKGDMALTTGDLIKDDKRQLAAYPARGIRN